jgi:hypothetical protein
MEYGHFGCQGEAAVSQAVGLQQRTGDGGFAFLCDDVAGI